MSDMNSNGHHHDHNHDEGGHTHTHQHSHQHTKQVLNRLAKATGHLQSVSRMVENGRDCSEVLIQLSAVIAALNSTGKIILDDHIDTCIVDAVHNGDKDAIENLKVAIDRFVK
ncbi:MAG: metal-sensing transcriptional repressor [Anaerovoracaceae bacterium]